MDCPTIELRLSEYVERSLPAAEMAQVAEHLHECSECTGLLEEMRLAIATCKSFPSYEPDTGLIERILLRTSGRPRTRSWRELLDQYLLRPMLTPRFAVGAGLAVLFMALVVNLMGPRISGVASALSPSELFRKMDRGVQEIYGGGLKLYDKKNEWQAQLNFLKNNIFNRLGFMIEKLDVPDEAKQKPGEAQQQQENAPTKKSSLLQLRT
jgi:hypothetical protein